MERKRLLAVFMLPQELAIVRGKIEASGISCQVNDELTVQTHNFLSNAVGGVKLFVTENDYSTAREILEECGFSAYEEPKPSKLEQSINTLFSGRKILILGAILVLVILLAALLDR